MAPKRSASRIYEGGRRAGVGAGSKSVRLTILVMIASIMIIIMMMLIFYLCIRTGFYSAAGFMASSVSGIEVFLPYSPSLPFSYSSSPLPYSLHIHSIIMFIKSNNPIITDNRPDRDACTIERCSHDGCQGLEGASLQKLFF